MRLCHLLDNAWLQRWELSSKAAREFRPALTDQTRAMPCICTSTHTRLNRQICSSSAEDRAPAQTTLLWACLKRSPLLFLPPGMLHAPARSGRKSKPNSNRHQQKLRLTCGLALAQLQHGVGRFDARGQ